MASTAATGNVPAGAAATAAAGFNGVAVLLLRPALLR